MTRDQFNEAISKVETLFLEKVPSEIGRGVVHYNNIGKLGFFMSGLFLKSNAGAIFDTWEVVQEAEKKGLYCMVKRFSKYDEVCANLEMPAGCEFYDTDIILDVYGFHEA